MWVRPRTCYSFGKCVYASNVSWGKQWAQYAWANIFETCDRARCDVRATNEILACALFIPIYYSMDPVTYDHLSVSLREMVRTNNKTQHKQQYALWCNSVRNERDEVNFNSTHFKMQCQSKRENQTKLKPKHIQMEWTLKFSWRKTATIRLTLAQHSERLNNVYARSLESVHIVSKNPHISQMLAKHCIWRALTDFISWFLKCCPQFVIRDSFHSASFFHPFGACKSYTKIDKCTCA